MRFSHFATVAAVLAGGCTSGDRTQFVVLVDSDFEVPSELSSFRAVVRDDAEAVLAEQSFDLVGALVAAEAGRYHLPVSFGVGPRRDDPTLPVRIEIEARATEDGVLFERRATTRFIEGRTLLLPMFLARRCQSEQCVDGETCTEHGCVSELVDPAELEVVEEGDEFGIRDGGLPAPDAEVDPSDSGDGDVSVPDALVGDGMSRADVGVDPDASDLDGAIADLDAGVRGDGGDAGPVQLDGGVTGTQFEIVAPVGGESWAGTEFITWRQVSGNAAIARILLSSDSGRTYTTTIATGAPNIGSFSWDTTSVPNGLDYRVQVQPLRLGSGDPDGPPARSTRNFAVLNTEWRSMSTLGAPQIRYRHTSVWTGTEMIVAGGRTRVELGGGGATEEDLATGGRYNPVTDTWVATSTRGAEPRIGHATVWTGSEMIVWGGYGAGYLRSGGRYDPAVDTWTTTSTRGAPTARANHVAVWTGSEMIVWGGASSNATTGSTYHDSGSSYDPVRDSWSPIPIAGAPEGRLFESTEAVWTGAEMIVWGGGNDSGYLDSGGRYDPVARRWAPTSTVGAPSPRDFNTLVWTGTEMVVWGVGASGGLQQSGARYDPVSDSWRPMSTINAPSGSLGHAAVWTGSRMIVWGGDTGGASPINGGAYDPVTDTWTPTLIAGAPAGRSLHTAVWTEREMLIWGGTDRPFMIMIPSSPAVSIGGRYTP